MTKKIIDKEYESGGLYILGTQDMVHGIGKEVITAMKDTMNEGIES